MDKSKGDVGWWVVGLVGVGGMVGWWVLGGGGVGEGFGVSNGGIEGREVDIGRKIGGGMERIVVKEGEFVGEGEVVGKMDSGVLEEEGVEGMGEMKEGERGVGGGEGLVEEGERESGGGEWVVNEGEGEVEWVGKGDRGWG